MSTNKTYVIQIQFAVIVTSFLLLSFSGNAQVRKNGELYQHDIKYEGNTLYISANYRYMLEEFVAKIKADSTLLVHIRGHVCCRPGKRIARRRARKVYRFLVQNGIERSRLTHKGYSNEMPLVYPERKKEDQERNRRVDFVLHKR